MSCCQSIVLYYLVNRQDYDLYKEVMIKEGRKISSFPLLHSSSLALTLTMSPYSLSLSYSSFVSFPLSTLLSSFSSISIPEASREQQTRDVFQVSLTSGQPPGWFIHSNFKTLPTNILLVLTKRLLWSNIHIYNCTVLLSTCNSAMLR